METEIKESVAMDITVERRERDGWYVYTSDRVPGLYLASQDDCAAYNDLPEVIAKLYELNLGVSVRVSHKLEHAEFLKWLTLSDRAHESVRQRTDAMMSRGGPNHLTFVVQAGDGTSSRQ